ncbi:endonuclease domain-containing 1 protein-like [Carettochelys insculpta]|uniref:endonuclease domain-containing 1 protein-like n=1 Tax=Carettochelys insculpta TaxID=44489 RepID=UPI003EC0482C
MGPLTLLGFALLWAGLGRAEVVPDFSTCKQFFYGGTEPQGFNHTQQAKICQKYENQHHFATLYDKQSRIPVWSAYTLHAGKCSKKTSETWKVEPQLSGEQEKEMKMERDVRNKTALKNNQATHADYEKTGYDRGHLNPSSFQCNEGQNATYTLTNAAPMDPCFNRDRWSELERNLKNQLTKNCTEQQGKAFLVTGVVPNTRQYKIPIEKNDQRRGKVQDASRVVVPSHVWTAVCCEHSTNNKKFSFAFLGVNTPGKILESLNITELNQRLRELYKAPSIQLFKDDCNENSRLSKDVLSEITKELLDDPTPDWTEQDPKRKKYQ